MDRIILAHVAIVVSKVANNAINEHLDVCLGITAPSRQISEKGTGNSVSSSSADRAHGSAMDDSTTQDDTPCDACLLVASERPVECNILSVGCPTPSCRGPLVSLHATAPRTRDKHHAAARRSLETSLWKFIYSISAISQICRSCLNHWVCVNEAERNVAQRKGLVRVRTRVCTIFK